MECPISQNDQSFTFAKSEKLSQQNKPSIDSNLNPLNIQQPKEKQIKVFSQAYPPLQEGQLPYETIRKPDQMQNSVGQKKRILQPQVKSQIHQKLLLLNFKAQNHIQSIKIRQYEMADLAQLRKLQDEWFPIRYTEEFYKKIINKYCYCLVAETVIKVPQKSAEYESQQREKVYVEEKIIVGAVVFELTDSQGYTYKSWSETFLNWFKTTDDSIYIMTLGVIDEFRKKGVGKMLVDSILDVSKQWNNVKLVYLHVISYNKAAINFYKKMGFTNLQSLSNFYHVGGRQFDGQVFGMLVNGGKNNGKWSLWLRKLFK